MLPVSRPFRPNWASSRRSTPVNAAVGNKCPAIYSALCPVPGRSVGCSRGSRMQGPPSIPVGKRGGDSEWLGTREGVRVSVLILWIGSSSLAVYSLVRICVPPCKGSVFFAVCPVFLFFFSESSFFTLFFPSHPSPIIISYHFHQSLHYLKCLLSLF